MHSVRLVRNEEEAPEQLLKALTEYSKTLQHMYSIPKAIFYLLKGDDTFILS